MNNINTIEVRNLKKVFGKFIAVDSISFEVHSGEIFGFLGPNGAGKSTTIKMLCALIKPTSGSASVAGYDVKNQAFSVRKNIGYMSQKFSLYEDLTVEENIKFFAGVYGLKNEFLLNRKKEIIELVGLNGIEKRLANELPFGWKQRLALACAIVHQPKVLFLDEPTAGVDPVSRRNFWELIYNLAENGTTLFVTTHYLDEAEYCNRIALIYSGKIKAIGTPSELKNMLDMFEIYEISCNKPVEAMALLQNETWVYETSIFGNSIHTGIFKTENGIDKITQFLNTHAIDVLGVRRIVPSLEDVFIHFTKAEVET
ncbi:MAG: putative ABC transporter ATP-binding protein [Ignavibacteriae bacterium]|nr:MAG: putative ABC transporter ATP-binding protein [Ignavibacteriota bacterium]